MDEKTIREALANIEAVANAATVPEHHRRALVTAVSSIKMALVMTAEQSAAAEQQYEATKTETKPR